MQDTYACMYIFDQSYYTIINKYVRQLKLKVEQQEKMLETPTTKCW